MITKQDLLDAQAAADKLFPELGTAREALDRFADELHTASTDMHAATTQFDSLALDHDPALDLSAPTAREPLDAAPSEDRAPEPIPITYAPRPADSPAAPASAADTLSALLDAIRALHARVEAEVPIATARLGDDPYDILLALKQESGKLNDTLYTLWLRHAWASLKQP